MIWVFSTFTHLDYRGYSSERKSLLSLELRHRWKQRHNTVCLCQRLCTISAHNNMDRHALKTLISQNIISSILFIFFPCIYSKVSENSPQGISLLVLKRIREHFAMTKTSFSTRGLCSLRAEPGFGAAGFSTAYPINIFQQCR